VRVHYGLHCAICGFACVAGIVVGLILDGSGFRAYPLFQFCLPMALVTGAASYVANRKFQNRVAIWVWIPGALLVGGGFFDFLPYEPLTNERMSHVWDQFFGAHCGPTECLYEAFLGSPFLGSVVYSVVAALFILTARSAPGISPGGP
jgi:hypothetical protein